MASTAQNIHATFLSVLAFILVSLPLTYIITNNLLSGVIGRLADSSGCPTRLGLAVHSIVFGFIIYGLMIINPV